TNVQTILVLLGETSWRDKGSLPDPASPPGRGLLTTTAADPAATRAAGTGHELMDRRADRWRGPSISNVSRREVRQERRNGGQIFRHRPSASYRQQYSPGRLSQGGRRSHNWDKWQRDPCLQTHRIRMLIPQADPSLPTPL